MARGGGKCERPIRVALCGLPAMLDGIVSALVDDLVEIEVVARLAPSDRLEDDLERCGADVLICALGEHEMRRRWRACVRRRALPAVLNLGQDASDGHVYAVCAHDHALGELGAQSLVDALREIGTARGR